MENEELKTLLDTLVGKTVAKWEFVDKPRWGEPYPGGGVHLHFTDGTEFIVYENQTAGEVCYEFGEQADG
jgi:hypothetical protein